MIQSLLARMLMGLIRLYQLMISPFLGPRCRFYPSCSTYCLESIRLHGSVKGIGLGALRLVKCHPFHPGGVDMVPLQFNVSKVSP